MRMSKWIGNAVRLLAGCFLMLGTAIAISIVFAYAFAVILLRRARRIKPSQPALTAGALFTGFRRSPGHIRGRHRQRSRRPPRPIHRGHPVVIAFSFQQLSAIAR
jgi:hypothetical protein